MSDEIPRQILLTVSQGQSTGGFGRQVPAVVVRGPVANPGVAPATVKGPLWFRKMDRNNDGDVSRREFLGSLEDFRRIDVDGDGLIDQSEADAADAGLRVKQ